MDEIEKITTGVASTYKCPHCGGARYNFQVMTAYPTIPMMCMCIDAIEADWWVIGNDLRDAMGLKKQ